MLGLWAWEVGLGLFFGSAVASVASTAYGKHPEGDLPLFAPGALELLDLLRHSLAARGPLVSLLLFLFVAVRVLGLLPEAAVLAELSFEDGRRPPPVSDAVGRAVRVLPATLALSILVTSAQLGVVVLGVIGAAIPGSMGSSRFDQPGVDKAAVALVLVSCLVAALVGVLGDLARAAVVRRDASPLTSLSIAITTWARRPLAITWSYAWRAIASLVPVALGMAVTARTQRSDMVAVAVITVLQQVIVGVRTAIRTSWMARTLRALG
jgi:hypothetical protein